MTQKTIFREVIKKPSVAVRAMLAGLKNPKIKINMATFGVNKYGQNVDPSSHFKPVAIHSTEVCIGCAAVATVLEFLPESKETYSDLYQETDLNDFEWVINKLRMAEPATLLTYFGIKEESGVFTSLMNTGESLMPLYTSTYEKYLQPYTDFAEALEELGL